MDINEINDLLKDRTDLTGFHISWTGPFTCRYELLIFLAAPHRRDEMVTFHFVDVSGFRLSIIEPGPAGPFAGRPVRVALRVAEATGGRAKYEVRDFQHDSVGFFCEEFSLFPPRKTPDSA